MNCTSCLTSESKRWYDGKCQNCRNADYYQKNKESIKAKASAWAKNNREKVNKIAAKWAANNREDKNYRESLRRARKLEATPKWLTKEQLAEIKNIYKNCPKGFEVDHIMPLKGKNSSGLHVPWNLQYLPVKENRSKGNRVEV